MGKMPLMMVSVSSPAEPLQLLPLAGLQDSTGQAAILRTTSGGEDTFGVALPIRAIPTSTVLVAPSLSDFMLITASLPYLYNGVNWERATSASAGTLGLFSGAGSQRVTTPGEWGVVHQPVAAAQATITRAAGAAGERHVCRGITVSLLGVAVQGPIVFVLRDGLTGAGSVLWSAGFVLPAGTSDRLYLSGLSIVGSAATAMTLETVGAPALTNLAMVALSGYTAAAA